MSEMALPDGSSITAESPKSCFVTGSMSFAPLASSFPTKARISQTSIETARWIVAVGRLRLKCDPATTRCLELRPDPGHDHDPAHGAVAFQEDRAGLALAVEFNLVDNFLWSNDYPHHEGSWPHSAEAIERQMGRLTGLQRAKILGLNAARFFKFDIDSLLKKRLAGISTI